VFVSDVLRDLHANSTGSRKITLEAWENLAERLQATREQTMRVAILGCPGPRSRRCRQAVALDDLDPFKISRQSAGHRQPADSRSNYDRVLT
jgi:hypothetical protein